MSTQPKTFLTPEEYLEIERQAEFKSEFYQGEMFAMAGAGYSHNRISANVIANLTVQLASRACDVLTSDMRVYIPTTGLYTYPDATIVCGPPQFSGGHSDTLLNPAVIIEVLSPSTEAYDRGRKFEHYRSIDSLQEYLLISSDRIHADRYVRQPGGNWLLVSAAAPGDTIALESIDCHLPLAALYDKVEFV